MLGAGGSFRRRRLSRFGFVPHANKLLWLYGGLGFRVIGVRILEVQTGCLTHPEP